MWHSAINMDIYNIHLKENVKFNISSFKIQLTHQGCAIRVFLWWNFVQFSAFLVQFGTSTSLFVQLQPAMIYYRNPHHKNRPA